MIVKKTDFEGLFVIEPEIFYDERGYFFESYSYKRYENNGITVRFVQDNESMSRLNTIRGLHLQVGKSAQGKLVSVVKGKLFDVAVDLRPDSPTFRRYFSMILDDTGKKQVYIPAGFAHGFATLKDNTILHYKCTAYYSPKDELTLIWNDPTIAIQWPVANPMISEKDKKGKNFEEIKKIMIRGEI